MCPVAVLEVVAAKFTQVDSQVGSPEDSLVDRQTALVIQEVVAPVATVVVVEVSEAVAALEVLVLISIVLARQISLTNWIRLEPNPKRFVPVMQLGQSRSLVLIVKLMKRFGPHITEQARFKPAL